MTTQVKQKTKILLNKMGFLQIYLKQERLIGGEIEMQ
jgi:hypothetical protein